MRLYFYCVMKKFRGKKLEIGGMDGQPIFFIKCEDLIAAVSSTNQTKFPVTESNQKRHEVIIQDFMEERPLLPFRFNCVVGESIGRGILQKYYNELIHNLEIIQDGEEYGVKIIRHHPTKVQKMMNLLYPATQKENSKSKLEAPQKEKILDVKTKVLATQIHTSLAEIAMENHKNLLLTGQILLEAEYLVQKRMQKKFESEIDRLKRLYPNLMMMVQGPLPPYHFNTIDITKDNTLRIGGPWQT